MLLKNWESKKIVLELYEKATDDFENSKFFKFQDK